MINIENCCCFTGHRADKLPFSLDETDKQFNKFYGRLGCAISDTINKGVDTFYCGMATGFDIIAGEHVALIKKLNKSIKLIGVVPFVGQENGWSREWKQRYRDLLAECDEVVTLNDTYAKWVFDERNRYMVDRSRYVLTYFDGSKGGTGNTVKYAVKHGRDVFNIYDTDPTEEIKARFKTIAYLIPPEENEIE